MAPRASHGSSREDTGEPNPNEPFELRPASPVEPGSVVAGKYRVDRHIGFGGMGVVCEGTHLELGTKVAIKFVRLERAGDERAVARFLTEARSAAQLRSEHTCRVVDCGRLESGSPYMVMEYLEGADLRTIISAQGPLPVAEAVSFVLQSCEALAEAHSRGIVHRDIKPENLFLTQGPDGAALIKVLDFGISKQLERSHLSRALTEPTESIGSPFHMSPEQMIDPTTVDARTDVWSLGVVLYELLTARLPFEGESTPQVCANVMTREPLAPDERNPEVPVELSRVVLGCLEKNREARFADMGALSRALQGFGGTTSGLAAERVERILVHAKESRSERRAASSAGEATTLPDGEAREEGRIPGLPSRRRGVAVAVTLAAASALGLYGYSQIGGRSAEPLPSPEVTPARSAEAARQDSRDRDPRLAASAGAAKPSKKRPAASRAKRKQRRAVSPVAPAPSKVPEKEPEPAPASSSLYPQITPVPEMNPPDEPLP